VAQLTIYLDQQTIERIENAAAERKVSVSRWVREKIESALRDDWPESFSRVFGSLADTDFDVPEDLDFGNDVMRSKM
jgi:hypothetical protein